MKEEVYRYDVGRTVPFAEVSQSLALAVLAAECLLGHSQVRMETAFLIDEEQRSCVVDASTDAGQKIARIFTGFLTKEFGEDAFEVRRMDRTAMRQGASISP